MNIKSYITPRMAFLLSMILIGVGLATSNLLMSWGEIGLGIAFLWDGKYLTKLKLIGSNKRILAFIGVFILFVVGLVHTSNWQYAFHDLKIKLPLLVIPVLCFSFFPMSKNEFRIVFHSIFIGVIFSMIFGWMVYKGWIQWKVVDMRSYSPFISNVRLGTLLVLSIILSGYLFLKPELRYISKYFYLVFAFGCICFLLLLQSLTGIVALVGTMLILSIHGLTQPSSRKASLLFLLAFVIILGTLTGIVVKEYHRVYDVKEMDLDHLNDPTPDGSTYFHDTTDKRTINGYYIHMYICNDELNTEWNKRSEYDYNGPSKKGWNVNGILIGYLTSKGLRKNGQEVRSLSDREIRAIENGKINFLQVHPLDIRGRVNQLLMELNHYKMYRDPNGRSFATRLETWKVAMFAFKRQLVFGYGTGDVKDEMKNAYTATGSKLLPQNQKNPHQQYLTVGLAVGIIGLILFIFLIYSPLFRFRSLHVLFVAALTIACISMLDEDTLETQAGCTQFVFIYTVTYLYHLKEKNRWKLQEA